MKSITLKKDLEKTQRLQKERDEAMVYVYDTLEEIKAGLTDPELTAAAKDHAIDFAVSVTLKNVFESLSSISGLNTEIEWLTEDIKRG